MNQNAKKALTVKTIYSENSLDIKAIIEKALLAFIEKEALKNSKPTSDLPSNQYKAD